MLESLDFQGLLVDVELSLSCDPCWAMVRWGSGDSFCSIASRPSPPYRDWVVTRAPPIHFGDLVAETRFHYRCMLFGASAESGTQTDESVVIELVNTENSPSSHGNRPGPFTTSGASAAVQYKAPAVVRPVRAPPVFEVEQPFSKAIEIRPVGGFPKVAGAISMNSLVQHAHASESTRYQFLTTSFDSRNRNSAHRRPLAQRLQITGPVGPPAEPYPIPPTVPPINANRPSRGVRFLLPTGAQELRPNPEIAIPRILPPCPPADTQGPETNPDLRSTNVLFAAMVVEPS